MKNIKNIIFSLLLISFSVSCVEDDYELDKIIVPSNLEVSYEVVGQSAEMPDGDGSGIVNFTASANNAMTYKFVYSDGFTDVSSDGTASHNFNKNGVNDYTVTVVASGAGGASSSKITVVTVFSDFDDPETKQLLTGGNSKTWYVAASLPGHLGVGPSAGDGFDGPIYYAAAPFEKTGNPCFYNDELTFSLENDNIVYNHDNKGQTFFNASYNSDFGGGGPDDQCLDLDVSGTKSVSLSPSTSGLPEDQTTGTVLNISGGGFMSYYIGASSYEILSLSANSMHVRAVMGNEPGLAWYLKFTTSQGEEETEEFVSEFNDLFWEADFNTDGPLDPDTWNFETGNNDGWGNNESQYYADDNAVLENGNLVITAKAESINGFNYSSSRITTKDKVEFKYGRIEARAKLPQGNGTWPAIWMLGATFPEESWPGVGEIDIMEHAGNRQNEIHGTLHYPGNSGGDADGDTKTILNASTEFHIYTVEWSAERIWFLVDGDVYHTFENNSTTPFNKDFFLIMNVAMGGTFGGSIDPAFSESSMEVDYIRVYQ